ncbi:MAG: cytochrome c oxidase subunit 3 [Bacteroidota bacterium]
MAEVSVDPKALLEGERPIYKASWGKLFMWFFLVSDAFTFSGLLIAYGASRVRAGSDGFAWADPEVVFTHAPILHELFHIEAPLVFVGLMTFVLILSSVTMVLAVEAGHRKSKKEVQKWVFYTIIGGVTFLSCQAYEWYHFISGTPDGGIMVSATMLENELESAGYQVPNLDDQKRIVFYPGGREHFFEAVAHSDGHGVEGHDHITSLGLVNGATITDEADIEKILEHAHHAHDGSYIMDWEDVSNTKEGFDLAELLPRGSELEDLATVKMYEVQGIAGNTVSLRMPNGFRVKDLTIIDELFQPAVDKEGHVVNDKGYFVSQGGANLEANQYGPPAFADLFFFVTGFHGTHVFSGVVLLVILYLNTRKGVYEKRGHYEMTEKIGLYWHFVDLVWVFVFTFFYLV